MQISSYVMDKLGAAGGEQSKPPTLLGRAEASSTVITRTMVRKLLHVPMCLCAINWLRDECR